MSSIITQLEDAVDGLGNQALSNEPETSAPASIDNSSDKTRGVIEVVPTPSEPTIPKSRKRTRAVLGFLEDQWFLFGLGILIAIASQVQVPASQQRVKETVVTYLCVSIIFFVTGCTLDTKTLVQNYGRWKLHLFVQVQCFLMTSAISFAVVSVCATNPSFMDPSLLIGIILMGCVATTISSNVVMTRQAHGNQALTVVQSTVGNFLGVFLTPALIVMYTSTGAWYTKVLPPSNGQFGEIYRRVLKQLGLSIFVPLSVGQIVHNLFPSATKKVFITWKLNKIGSVCLLMVIWQTYDQAFSSRAFETIPASNMVFIVFISAAFFLVFWLVAFFISNFWLPRRDTIAVCYCVPAKTPAMGVPLSEVMFVGLSAAVESKIQIPMVIYQGLQIVFGSLLIIFFRKWVRPQEMEQEQHAAQHRVGDGEPLRDELYAKQVVDNMTNRRLITRPIFTTPQSLTQAAPSAGQNLLRRDRLPHSSDDQKQRLHEVYLERRYLEKKKCGVRTPQCARCADKRFGLFFLSIVPEGNMQKVNIELEQGSNIRTTAGPPQSS